jgi:hypothetical protein
MLGLRVWSASEEQRAMNADIFAEWLRRQGQQVVRSYSSYWQSDGLGVYQAFPYHWLIEPTSEELHELMFCRHATALRYSSPVQHGSDAASYHAVYTADHYGFDVLTTKARNNVRRGLRSCTITRIPFERYVDEGWELRVDTLARQRRRLKESQDAWRRRGLSAGSLAGFEVWAAQVQNKLAATLLIFRMEDWFYMIYQQCHRNFLKEHVNNALSFAVTQDLTRRLNVHGIFYGMQSLDAPASVDQFKFQVGFEARPVRQCAVFHPYLAPMANRVTYQLSKALLALSPQSRRLAKAEGMLRLFLAKEGRRRLQRAS